MSDMIVQDPPADELDDLRALAEDDTDTEIATEVLQTVEEAPSEDDATSTGELQAVEDSAPEDAATSTGELQAVEDSPPEPERVTSDVTDDDPIASSKAPEQPAHDPHPAPEARSDVPEPSTKDTPTPQVASKPVAAVTAGSDDYNPTIALRLFNMCRDGFIRVFDLILTGIAIIVEQLAALDWAGYRQAISGILSTVHQVFTERVPRKLQIGLYACVLLLVIALPVALIVLPIATKPSPLQVTQQPQTIPVSQSVAIPQNDMLAPFFTPTVQQWAEDIERWTSNTEVTPDQLAVVMQLSSCGNAAVSSGLFGIAEGVTTPSDVDAQAQTALNQLQSALAATDGNVPMALAVYVDGEDVMTAPFGTWSLQARDMFILGRIMLRQAEQNAIVSPDLNTWLQSTGVILCTQAQSTRNS